MGFWTFIFIFKSHSVLFYKQILFLLLPFILHLFQILFMYTIYFAIQIKRPSKQAGRTIRWIDEKWVHFIESVKQKRVQVGKKGTLQADEIVRIQGGSHLNTPFLSPPCSLGGVLAAIKNLEWSKNKAKVYSTLEEAQYFLKNDKIEDWEDIGQYITQERKRIVAMRGWTVSSTLSAVINVDSQQKFLT